MDFKQFCSENESDFPNLALKLTLGSIALGFSLAFYFPDLLQ